MYEDIAEYIRDVKDFPKPGIVFKDITPALADGKCLQSIIEAFYDIYKSRHIDKIAVIESRGFLLGAPLACRLGCGLALLRKPGKLPAEKIKESYDLEYGSAALEIHTDTIKKGEKVLIIDDLLATGGTAEAAAHLVKRLGGEIEAFAFMIELEFCQGRSRLSSYGEVEALLKY